ncbi:MAG: DUF362 domain-containing protein [Bradymonadales bacterium]|nr:DUF362 domain-containing protein [Bradymonadales bacterium]
MATVVIADVRQGLKQAIDDVFLSYGGVHRALPEPDGCLYIKPNAVHFTAHTYTDPRLLDAMLSYLRDHGYRRLAVMESCTGGNFTRLVFKVIGYDRICRRYGAKPVYLDEGPVVEVTLAGEEHPIRVPKLLAEQIIRRNGNAYLGLPKLKTHCMTTVTLGVKNQQAFPIQEDRMERHTRDTLPHRLAALYRLVRPDFCIIEGLTATAHGHFPPTALLEECLVPTNVLIGGMDTLAVDVVGAKVLGYDVCEVAHLKLCADWGLGDGRLDQIEVHGLELDRFTRRLPCTLLGRFHPEVRIVQGRERACVQGCKGNSECILEMLTNDHGGRGGWTLIFGKGFTEEDLSDLPGDILLVGPCAVDELAVSLGKRYPDKGIYTVPAHNDLMMNTRYQAKLSGVKPLDMVPLNPLVAALTLLQARMHGLTARIPPLRG